MLWSVPDAAGVWRGTTEPCGGSTAALIDRGQDEVGSHVSCSRFLPYGLTLPHLSSLLPCLLTVWSSAGHTSCLALCLISAERLMNSFTVWGEILTTIYRHQEWAFLSLFLSALMWMVNKKQKQFILIRNGTLFCTFSSSACNFFHTMLPRRARRCYCLCQGSYVFTRLLVGLFTQKILDEFQQNLADPVNFGSAPYKGTDPGFFFVMLVNIIRWGMSTFLLMYCWIICDICYWEHSDICLYLSGQLNSAQCRGTVGINVLRWVPSLEFGVWFFKMVYYGIVMTPRMSQRVEGVILK